MVFRKKGFEGEARGNSPNSTALPRSGYGPQSQRVPPAWKTKKGSGPSGDGVGGGSDSRELEDVRTQPPPLSPPPPRGGAPRPPPERFPSDAGSGVQTPAHAQARAAWAGAVGVVGGQGEEPTGEERPSGRVGAGPGPGGGAAEWGGAEPAESRAA